MSVPTQLAPRVTYRPSLAPKKTTSQDGKDPTTFVSNQHSQVEGVRWPWVKNQINTLGSSSSADDGKVDRACEQFRRVYLRHDVSTRATGSAYLELENTKVLCSVYGPRQRALTSRNRTDGESSRSFAYARTNVSASSSSDADTDCGRLRCEVHYAPFARKRRRGIPNRSGGTSAVLREAAAERRRWRETERDVSRAVEHALIPSVILKEFPGCIVEVFVLILEVHSADNEVGSAISCASMALANASIPLYDLVSACTTLVSTAPQNDEDNADSVTLIDPTQNELAYLNSVIETSHSKRTKCLRGLLTTIAFMPSLQRVTYFKSSGSASAAETAASTKVCIHGCSVMCEMMRNALKESITEKKSR